MQFTSGSTNNDNPNNPNNNRSLHQFRQTHRKQIRRQYIETYQRNKRKQLFSSSSLQQNNPSQVSSEQQQLISFVDSLSVEMMESDPNNVMTHLLGIVCGEVGKGKWVGRRLGKVLEVVHGFIGNRLTQSRSRISQLKLALTTSRLSQPLSLLTPYITNTLTYNQVFFQPLSNTKQLYFKQTNPYDPLNLNAQQSNHLLEQLQVRKVNVYLFFELLIAVTYEISPEGFVKGMVGGQEREINKRLDNGYGGMLMGEKEMRQARQRDEERMMKKFISIYSDFYHLSFDLLKTSFNIRYMTGTLQNLHRHLTKLYHPPLSQNQFTPINPSPTLPLPFLWFDIQKLFIKESTKPKLTLRLLQFLNNMTSMVTMNEEFDGFVHGLDVLQEIEELVKDSPVEREEVRLVGGVYSNLVEEGIAWVVKEKERGKEGGRIDMKRRFEYDCHSIQEEEQDSYHHYSYLSCTPGIYPSILSLMCENLSSTQSSQQLNQLVYIIKTILQNYQVPPKTMSSSYCANNNRPMNEHQSTKTESSATTLTMTVHDCQTLSSIITQLFQHITSSSPSSQPPTQFLDCLFITISQKMLPHLLYVHQLPQILRLVITTHTQRIWDIEAKRWSPKSKNAIMMMNNNGILEESQEKRKRGLVQNLKVVVRQCEEVVRVVADEAKSFGIDKGNCFSMVQQHGFGQKNIVKDFIDVLYQSWLTDQLQYCQLQFIQFITTTLQLFPQHLITLSLQPHLLSSQQQQQQPRFLLILLQTLSHQPPHPTLPILTMLQSIMTYICNLDMRMGGKERKRMIHNHFAGYRDEWGRILQGLEGMQYAEKSDTEENKEIFGRIDAVYDVIEKMLNDAVGDNSSVEVEI